MSRILSHPFRVSGAAAVTVEQDSDAANAEQIAVLILTRKGERVLTPAFGIEDPTFAGISPTEISLGLALFGPPVAIENVSIIYPDDTTQEVVIRYAES